VSRPVRRVADRAGMPALDRRPPADPSPAVQRQSLAASFNREWSLLATDPAVRVHVHTWPTPEGQFEEPAALLAATGRDGGLPVERADAVLAAVVARAGHDALAARLALQRVVPGLVNVAARRTRSRPADRQSLFDDLAGTAWLVIRAYPLERRPVKVAVNILRDTEYLTCVRPSRLRTVPVAPVPLWKADQEVDSHGRLLGPTSCEEAAEVLAAGRAAGVDVGDLDLLRSVFLSGSSTAEVARALGVTPRTVYNWRVLAAARVAGAVAA